MNFSFCPRCNETWEEGQIRNGKDIVKFLVCETCDVRFFENPQQLVFRNFIKSEYNLVWDFKDNCCYYSSLNDVMRGRTLKLPWLPFSINKDKFKTILFFS